MSDRTGNVAEQWESISMDVKIQMTRRVEAGEHQVHIDRSLALSTSTIKTILKNPDKIRASVQSTTLLTTTKTTCRMI